MASKRLKKEKTTQKKTVTASNKSKTQKKSQEKKPSKLKEAFKKITAKGSIKNIKLLPYLIIVIGVVGIFSAFFFTNKELLLSIIPGYYQIDEAQNNLKERNRLIEENNTLFEENLTTLQEINKLGDTSADFEEKSKLTNKLRDNIISILLNHDELNKNTKASKRLRTFNDLREYFSLLEEVDKSSKSAREKEIVIYDAKLAFYSFRLSEAQYSECTEATNRGTQSYSQEAEKKISEDLTKCIEILKATQNNLENLENELQIELPLTKEFLEKSLNFWSKSLEFHQALAGDDVATAETKNNEAAAIQAELAKLDSEKILQEFNNVYLNAQLDELNSLIDKAEEAQKKADAHYEKNLKSE